MTQQTAWSGARGITAYDSGGRVGSSDEVLFAGGAVAYNAVTGQIEVTTDGGGGGAYVRTGEPDTITAQHTFAPVAAQPPFALGGGAVGQLVSGLNADRLDGQHGSYYLDRANHTGSGLSALGLGPAGTVLAATGAANVWTDAPELTAVVFGGPSAASSGEVRLQNNGSVRSRNTADDGDLTLVRADDIDNAYFGSSAGVQRARLQAAGDVRLNAGNADIVVASGTDVVFTREAKFNGGVEISAGSPLKISTTHTSDPETYPATGTVRFAEEFLVRSTRTWMGDRYDFDVLSASGLSHGTVTLGGTDEDGPSHAYVSGGVSATLASGGSIPGVIRASGTGCAISGAKLALNCDTYTGTQFVLLGNDIGVDRAILSWDRTVGTKLGDGTHNFADTICTTGRSLFLRYNETTRVQVNSAGIGFFGATPVTRPVAAGSRGGNAALASLLTALANLGLITDSTTA